MGFTLVMPFLPLYFRELGVTDVGEIAFWSGLSLGVTPALTALLSPAWGLVADRFGRKLMVERSLLSFVLVMAATAYVWRPWHVFALRAFQGLFAGYGALTLTMAVESAPPGRVPQSIGLVQTAQRLGPAVGPALGGLVAQLVGLRRAFIVASAFYVAAFLLVLVLYRERPVRAAAPAAAGGRVSFRNIVMFKSFLLLMLAIFGFQFVDRSFGPILPIFIAQIGTPLERVPIVSGALFSLMAGSAALGHHISGRLLARRPARAVMTGGAVVGTGALVMVAAAPDTRVLAFALPLFGVAVGAAMTAAYTAGSAMIPEGAHGTGFGFLSSASLAGLALSPVFAGAVGAFSIRAVFMFDAVALVVLASVMSRVLAGAAVRTEAPRSEDA